MPPSIIESNMTAALLKHFDRKKKKAKAKQPLLNFSSCDFVGD